MEALIIIFFSFLVQNTVLLSLTVLQYLNIRYHARNKKKKKSLIYLVTASHLLNRISYRG